MSNTPWYENDALQFLAVTSAFAVLYGLNNYLTPFLHLVPGAHLVHIPSGIKFLMVLIFGITGALSIATVSLVAGMWVYFPGNAGVSLALAAVNALAPLLALKWVSGSFKLDPDLEHLNLKALVKMGLVFSLLNSASNQMVIYWYGLTNDFLTGWGVMVVGDITGFFLSLVLLKSLGRWVKSKAHDPDPWV
jgi:hypothetical protein